MVTREEKILTLGPGDLLMLGGGPLMDDIMLAKWFAFFKWARRAGARTMIAGCGFGPLRRSKTVALVNLDLRLPVFLPA